MGLISKIIDHIHSSISPVSYAKKLGVKIGEDVNLMGSPIWGSEPYLISIGDHTTVSFECAFITHDGGVVRYRKEERYKSLLKIGTIKIGSNCFIGARSTFLPGVEVGDNSIVGACSLVTKSIPSGEVWAGVPAKFITKTTDYLEKCLAETPDYDLENFRNNKEQEIKRIFNLK